MFELVALLVAGAACVAALAITVFFFKVVVHVAFWSLKLLLLPFILIAILVKFTLLAALAGVVLAIILPILIVLAIVAAPFVLVSALT